MAHIQTDLHQIADFVRRISCVAGDLVLICEVLAERWSEFDHSGAGARFQGQSGLRQTNRSLSGI
jgi:hypothetical protein